ncbi:MAG: hypothetical protein IKP88_07495 [Lachnospiraceae bacterium]|nr:hypothetical protein [Lachnospiraceae bacterium]
MGRKSKCRFRKSVMGDNKGSTLIEIIISVLIVGIAFVPLMMGLNAALTANRKTEKDLYAENVATNVIEVAKRYGTKKLPDLVAEGATDSTKGISKILTGATMTGGGNSYTIENISSGTKDGYYTAVISFNSVSGDQNDFSGYPTIEGVSNAISVSVAQDSIKEITDHFFAEALSRNSSLTEADKNNMEKDAAKWLKRDIYITLTDGTDADVGKTIVNKKIVYTAQNVNNIEGWENKWLFYEASATVEPWTKENTEGDSTKEIKCASTPGSIILSFKELKDKKKKDYKLGIGNDVITITRQTTGDELYLYCLCENGSTLKGKGYHTDIKSVAYGTNALDTTNEVHAYSNLDFIFSGGVTETSFGSTTGKQSKLKEITVTVKDNEGTAILDKTSTMIEFE